MTIRARVRFKADDIWDAPEDGNVYEVIDGDLYMTPAPAWIHQRVVSRLFLPVAEHVFRTRLGEIVTAPTGVALDDENGLQPDILFISNERRGIISERGVDGHPTWLSKCCRRRPGLEILASSFGATRRREFPTTGPSIPSPASSKSAAWAATGTSCSGRTASGTVSDPTSSPGWRSASPTCGRSSSGRGSPAYAIGRTGKTSRSRADRSPAA